MSIGAKFGERCRVTTYLGKRIKFSAFVKADGLQNWAGLWARVDKGHTSVAFDNMQNRPIKGATGWSRYEVVLDVPEDATGIAFGILVNGSGTAWINGANFEIVGTDVSTTSTLSPPKTAPSNLSFEQ
jgi:hypothetical protein